MSKKEGDKAREEAASPSPAAAAGEEGSSAASMKTKVCAVCSDRALGYNFNALTCESCKAFFRRNALKNKEFKCPFSDKCEVTVVTRRFCQKCRLKKCFDVGMKKEWILSDAEKQQKRQKIEENRAKKRTDAKSPAAAAVAAAGGLSGSSSPVCPGSPAAVSPAPPPGASLVADRPQARVLPSARASPAASSEETPKSKAMRFDSRSVSHSPADTSVQHSVPSPGFLTPQQQQPATIAEATNPHVTLIKQELVSSTSSSPPDQSVQSMDVGTSDSSPPPLAASPQQQHSAAMSAAIHRFQQEQQQHHATLSHLQQQPPHPAASSVPPSVESVMLQPLVNAAAAIMATAPIMESESEALQLRMQQQQQQQPPPHSAMFSSAPAPPTPADSSASAPGIVGASSLVRTTNGCGSVQQPLPARPPAIIPDFSHTSNLDDIVAVAIEAEFHVQNINSFQNGQILNDPERSRLDELFMASRALVEPIDHEKNVPTEPNNLISVINLTDLAIKRIIRMTKKISPFINMCQEDQIALLKGGCTELMILRSVINYNPDKNTWRLPSNDPTKELSMELLKEASHLGVNLYEEHQRFVTSFDPRWRTDENVMLLLSAIALFNPKRSSVTHRDVIKLEQDTYYYLLRRYLETACGPGPGSGCQAKKAYLHLIGRLQDLHRLNESHIQLFLEVNPKLVEPLLIEIFDLKPYSN